MIKFDLGTNCDIDYVNKTIMTIQTTDDDDDDDDDKMAMMMEVLILFICVCIYNIQYILNIVYLLYSLPAAITTKLINSIGRQAGRERERATRVAINLQWFVVQYYYK